jgi:hypothetical protein
MEVRFRAAFDLPRHVEDQLLPLKQTVRHPLDPRTKVHVVRVWPRDASHATRTYI